MKNVFYLILKALFIFKIFKFLTWQFGHVEKDYNTILVNISQIKGKQTKKFGQLIEHPKRNIFLLKLCRKQGRETSSRQLFFEKKSLYQEKASGLQLGFTMFW